MSDRRSRKAAGGLALTMTAGDLNAAVTRATSVVEARTTIPILSHIALAVAGGTLTLRGTDLERQMEVSVPAGLAAADGAVCIPGGMLSGILSKLPKTADVTLALGETKGGIRLTVTSGRSHFALPVLEAADFPSLDGADAAATFELDAKVLAGLLDHAAFAMGSDETRYYLTGIHIVAHGESLRAVATDGTRMAMAATGLPDGAARMPAVIVPRRTVAVLRGLLKSRDDVLALSVSATRFVVQADGFTLTSKLIDGTFPDYERVIPGEPRTTVRVDRRAFAEAVDRVATIADEQARGLTLAVGGDAVQISMATPEGSAASDEVAAEVSGGKLKIGFRPRYLLDIMGALSGDSIDIGLGGAGDPIRVSGDDDDDAGLLYVLMPMRV